MKKLFFVLLTFFTVGSATAQIKISTLPTVSSTNADSLWVPVVEGTTTKKARGYLFKSPFNAIQGTGMNLTGSFPNITFNSIIPTYYQTAIPYANGSGILTSDSTKLKFEGGYINVGATADGSNGIFMNGGRAEIHGSFNGMNFNIGSGYPGGGTYDQSKSYTFQNRGNTYMTIGTTGSISTATFATDVTLNGALKLSTGTLGAGRVLTDVAGNGIATWQPPSGGGGSMTWPSSAGIAIYNGSSNWGTSITDNSSVWNSVTTKLNISDTGTMLSPYLRSGTAAATYQPIGTYLTTAPTLQAVTTAGNTSQNSLNVQGNNNVEIGVTSDINPGSFAKMRMALGSAFFSIGTQGSGSVTIMYPGGANTSKVINLPDASGTFALTSDLGSYALTSSLTNYLLKTDTAAMLSPYGRSTTINNAIALKLNISDTATMLNPYVTIQEVRQAIHDSAIDVNVSSPLTYSAGTLGISESNTSTNGYLSAANFTAFNNKQSAITLTTTGTSGAATFSGGTLNIPQYAGGGGGTWGSITGTLSSQTDLQSALNLKFNKSNPFQMLTDGATTTWAFGSGINAAWTIAGNRSLAITSDADGDVGILTVTQDATGGRTITFPGGDDVSGLTQNTTANAVTTYSYIKKGSTRYWKGGAATGGGGGSGSVTSVSGLSPLFTTANATTTPTFSLSNSTAFKIFGRAGGTGIPSYLRLDSMIDGQAGVPINVLENGTTGKYEISMLTANAENDGFVTSTMYNDWYAKADKTNSFITLTDLSTTTWNFGSGVNAAWTIAGNNTLAITSDADGDIGILAVTQDATGGRTITFPAGDNVSGITQNTTANAVTTYSYIKKGSIRYWKGGAAAAAGDVTLTGTQTVSNKTLTNAKLVTSAGTATVIPINIPTGVVQTSVTSGDITRPASGVFTAATSATENGILPSEQYSVVGSDFTLSAALGVQSAFPTTGDVWTLAGSTLYEVEGSYTLTTGNTTTKTTALAFALAGGATINFINLQVIGYNSVPNTVATAQGTTAMTQVASTVITATATTAGVQFFFRGVISMNAGGTVTPQINFSANPGGTNLMKAGSYIKFKKLGTNTFTTIGAVN